MKYPFLDDDEDYNVNEQEKVKPNYSSSTYREPISQRIREPTTTPTYSGTGYMDKFPTRHFGYSLILNCKF